jgi:hypothetical protein
MAERGESRVKRGRAPLDARARIGAALGVVLMAGALVAATALGDDRVHPDRSTDGSIDPRTLAAAREHARVTGDLLRVLSAAQASHGHPMSATEKMLLAQSVLPARIRYTAAEDGSAVVTDPASHCMIELRPDPTETDRITCSGVDVPLRLLFRQRPGQPASAGSR